jgi:D-arabinose 1-dehydrogenase
LIGLPVEVLVELAGAVKNELKTSLDVVLSYSHMTLQNTTLKDAVPKFYAAGIQRILTGSPLSMGLLRSAGPQPWHPAAQSQKDAVIRAGEYIERHGHNMADTSMRFVFAQWDGTVIGGWSSVKELEDAVVMWHRVKDKVEREEDERLWQGAREVMGKEVDTMWASPPKGWVFSNGSKVE